MTSHLPGEGRLQLEASLDFGKGDCQVKDKVRIRLAKNVTHFS
jgi:hypothetical protein